VPVQQARNVTACDPFMDNNRPRKTLAVLD
jgi:hypothetical protein